MAAFDFPTSPSVGDTYPVTPAAGVPVYRWDGEKWTTIGGAMNGKPPVYADGTVPMKAQLTVVNPPVNPTDAAAKTYVDAADSLAWSIAPQTLTAAQQVQTRQNIHAAPGDAMAFSGMQINGGMELSQQLGTAGTTATFAYAVDGWIQSRIGTASIKSTQGPWSSNGLVNTLNIEVMTAQASFTGNQGVWILQYIEGYRVARLGWGTANAQPITIGFWWGNSGTSGTYSGSIRNAAQGSATRSYAFTFTQSAGTLTYYTVTIPGDTGGTWNSTSGIGLMLTFSLACGPTYTAPSAWAWLNGDYAAAPGQVNGVATLSSFMRLTGVIVLPGMEAPSVARAPYIMRPYSQELITCSRYLQFNRYGEQGYFLAGTQGVFFHSPVVPYRSGPTMSITTASIYMEIPYQVGITVTSPSLIAGHMAATGGDYRISGSYNNTNAGWQDYTLGIYTQNILFDARL